MSTTEGERQQAGSKQQETLVNAMELLQVAVAKHQNGQASEAEAIYRRLLSANPAFPEIWHLLGLAQSQGGRLGESESSFRRAIEMSPSTADYHSQLAVCLRAQGKNEEGLRSAHRALELDPENPNIHYNLGNALFHEQRYSEAAAHFQRVTELDPGAADAHLNLGCALRALGRHRESLTCFDKALELDSSSGVARMNAGAACLDLGMLPEALEHYRKAVANCPELAGAQVGLAKALGRVGKCTEAELILRTFLQTYPDSSEALCELSTLMTSCRRPEDAEQLSARLLQLDPSSVDGYINRAAALIALGRIKEAEELLQNALRLSPGSKEARINLASCHIKNRQMLEASRHLVEVLRVDPKQAEAWHALGVGFQSQNRIEEALAAFSECCNIEEFHMDAWLNQGAAFRDLALPEEAERCYNKVLDHDPGNAAARLNRGLVRLQTGRWSEGWEDYESRWKVCDATALPRRLVIPEWRGEPLKGASILLRAEQGFGDTLQFIRFATAVHDLGARVVVEAPEALKELVSSVRGVSNVITDTSPVPPVDYQAFLMSLPKLLSPKTPLHLGDSPYLASGSINSARMANRRGTRPKVGIVWAGSPAQREDGRRSLRWHEISLLLEVQDVHWFSLQVGGNKADVEQMKQDERIEDWGGHFRNFSDTAKAIGELDLVISVCTSVTHLAGALGAPVWTLLAYSPCWRWGLGGENTPWYRSMRLFRQQERGRWKPVIQSVKGSLKTWIESWEKPNPGDGSQTGSM